MFRTEYNFFHKAETDVQILEHAKNIPEAEERRRSFILDTVQNHEKNCFSANVLQCSIVYDSAVHVQLCCFKIFFIYYHCSEFFHAGLGSSYSTKCSFDSGLIGTF